jgi:hypothetical protein
MAGAVMDVAARAQAAGGRAKFERNKSRALKDRKSGVACKIIRSHFLLAIWRKRATVRSVAATDCRFMHGKSSGELASMMI